jgi:hypothetical protein
MELKFEAYEYDKWVVLFDLENCLIKHWDEPTPINTEEIRAFLEQIYEYGYSYTFGIYSYALWRKVNREILINELLPVIEKGLGIKFDTDYIFLTSDIIEDFSKKHSPIDYAAYCSVISKQNSLLDFQRLNPKFDGCSIALVDPTVTHGMNVYIPGGNTLIFINSEGLVDFKRTREV